MNKNIEIKFLHDAAHRLDDVLVAYHFDKEDLIFQQDTYLHGAKCYFKLRANNGSPSSLLRYRRLTSPVLRESDFERWDLEHDEAKEVAKYIVDHVIKAGIVKKHRRRLECREFLLNIDTIVDDDETSKLYSVVEIEYFVRDDNFEVAQRTVDNILKTIGVRPHEIIPYSNIHMVNMLKNSKIWRDIYHRKANEKRHLFLVDGGSGTGKSTVKEILVDKHGFKYAKRDTTRSPRPDDISDGDYNFVSRDQFNRKAISGEYIEFRDFLFGMSYGLAWDTVMAPLCEGRDVIALINLGNGFFTKKLFPEATVALLTADVDTIRKRLTARGPMTQEQIEERVQNNQLAVSYADAYDLHIDTAKFSPVEVAKKIAQSVQR
jgi:guanylate kinase/adenylate cyclase class IV